jgi:murein DD-endopeptidase MepM/ murein hydrolase activator NlpD
MKRCTIYLLFLLAVSLTSTNGETTHLDSLSYTDSQFVALSESTIASKNRILKGIRKEEYTFPEIYRYEVKPGEDIWTIIAKTSLNIDTIATLNRIDFIGMVKERSEVLLPDTLGVFLDPENHEIEELIEKYLIDEESILSAQDPVNPEKTVFFIPEVELSFLERTYITGIVFRAPLIGAKTSGYGFRKDPFVNEMTFHGGVDIAADEGKLVRASRGGQVLFAEEGGGYGNLVVIQHELGYYTLYGHLMEILVDMDTEIETGQALGKVGTTGITTGPHLHFEIRRLGTKLNPENIPLFLDHR